MFSFLCNYEFVIQKIIILLYLLSDFNTDNVIMPETRISVVVINGINRSNVNGEL